MTTWSDLLKHPGVILADGAMGTMLFAAGLEHGDALEFWNAAYPDRVGAVHEAYIHAGSRVVLTNTFGGNRFRLSLHGLADRVEELNRLGAQVARQAVDRAGGKALVAGDLGPSGGILAPVGDLAFEGVVEAFAEQARGLAAGGVDLFWIETMSDLEEVRAAVEGVRSVSGASDIVATMTFDTHGFTMMGVSPEKAAQALQDWGASAIGGNCGNGPDEILAVIEKMRKAAPQAALVAKANAGIPRLVGERPTYEAGPEEMATYAVAAAKAGARIIGACCGSTPTHVQAMSEALSQEKMLSAA